MEKVFKNLQVIGVLLISLALVWGIFLAQKALNNQTTGRTIVVNGTATKEITPDLTVISGTWMEKGANTEEARAKVKEKSTAGLTALKALGIADTKISTTSISVNPNYDYSIGMNKIVDYSGSTSISIKLDSTSKAEEVIDLLTKQGVASVYGPSLDLSNDLSQKIQNELKIEAVAKATAQAKDMVAQTGGKLGDVLTISGGDLSGGGITPYPTYASDTKAMSATGSGAIEGAVGTSSIARDSADIYSGQKEVSVTVSVTFRLK